ncbi:hypothetical protein [Streptomyces sp. NPDC001876]|uniref:DUF6932 family protein n=1 Tax=Streptomyces sp. NPDC001876 TaxID=3154402 RepID=UPI003325997F
MIDLWIVNVHPSLPPCDYTMCRLVADGAGGTVHGGHSLIPPLTSGGLLPVGRHLATLDELHDMFVIKAPHPEHRQRIFSALELYVSLARDLLPRATLWVDGGFCTYKPIPPKDVDLVLVVSAKVVRHFDQAEWTRMNQLLTLQQVSAGYPQIVEHRVQPMGGLVDAFLAEEENPAELDLWDHQWSRVTDDNGAVIDGAKKGYLEVEL